MTSNHPDFVLQTREVEQRLKAEWQSVQKDWQDGIADAFNTGVMEHYMRNFQQYITGEGISGYGLEQLLQQMDRHLQDMASIASN